MSRFLSVSYLISAFCYLTVHAAVAAAAQEQIVFTQLIHRHGARGPLAAANASHWCPAAGCGLLNDEGKDMLVQLGKYLRGRYSSLYFGGDDNYVPNLQSGYIYTRATDKPRTIQSADGVLRGLFPAISSSFYPVVNNVASEIDTLLTADAWPAYNMWQSFESKDKKGEFPSLLAPDVTANFPNVDVIKALAAEALYDGYCAKQDYNAICISKIQDLAASLNAIGTLAKYPLMSTYFDQLNAVKKALHTLQWRYEPTEYALDKARGTVQDLAQNFVSNMLSYMSGQMGPARFIHYSAHDGTTMPFTIAIGDPEMMPPFGQAYIVDLVADAGQYFVKGIKGAPQQTPGPHTYTMVPLKLGGMAADGAVYYTSDTVTRIPIEDFGRYVDSTKGTDPKGMCLVENAVVSGLGCDAVGSASDAACLPYRVNCPQWACPTGTYMRYADYACVTTDPNEL